MKIVDAKCKNCGAELTFDSGKTMLFCPYCGTKLLIIDGDEVKAEKVRADAYREVELAREETKRERNRQEHEREKEIIEKGDNVRIELERLKSERQSEREKRRHERRMQRYRIKQEREWMLTEEERNNRSSNKAALGLEIFALVCFIVLTILLLGMEYDIKQKEAIGMIGIGNQKDYVGKNYKAVVSQFESMGFENIDTIDLHDQGLFRNKADTVESVSVNGNSHFGINDRFDKKDKVVISYH